MYALSNIYGLFAVMMIHVTCFSFQSGYLKYLSTDIANFRLSSSNGINEDMSASRKKMIPQRHDVCKVIASGIVGATPKDQYLANGHFVLNFPLAITGHFLPIHTWEENKPAETMWMQSEVWDDEARRLQQSLMKGSYVHCSGYLIFNKWIDKATGEEKKLFKFRVTKFLPREEFADLQNKLGFDDMSIPSIEDTESPVDTNFDVYARQPALPIPNRNQDKFPAPNPMPLYNQQGFRQMNPQQPSPNQQSQPKRPPDIPF